MLLRRTLLPLLLLVLLLPPCAAPHAQEIATTSSPEREAQLRDRYLQALRKNPFQGQAFDKVYESYLSGDGVDAWVERLQRGLPTSETRPADLVLLGRIYTRQFKTNEAIRVLEEANAQGAAGPEFDLLLGTLYYQAGQDRQSAELLSTSLDTLVDQDQRSRVCRMLGNVYLRRGERDLAIAAWKRLIESDKADDFAYIELAEVYQDHRMWQESIEVLNRLVEIAEGNPYRQCWALRAMGDAQSRLERYAEAIATYEKALGLAAPGNWLFEDVKQRLVSVYQDLGDLQGLVDYLHARISATPSDIEFRDLLAETYRRMEKPDLAETEWKTILERAPKRTDVYEKLIDLFEASNQPDKVQETYGLLIELMPGEPDYLRRLGEVQLKGGHAAEAKATWQRVLGQDPSAAQYALLGEWYESYDFPDDAITAYEQALATQRDKEWVFRVAALRHEKGEKDQALALWQSVLTDRSTASDYAEVASLLLQFGEVQPAEPLLRKAMDLEPDNLEHAAALARFLTQQGRHEEAVPVFTRLAEQQENEFLRDKGERGLVKAYEALGVLGEKQKAWEAAVQADSQAVEPRLRLARLYEHSGNRQGAVELYRQVSELQPDKVEHLRTLAVAYASIQQHAEALAVYKRLVDLDPNRAAGYYREMVKLHVRGNEREDAIAAAQKTVELVPADPDARTDLAQVYMMYEKPEEALAQYREALRMEPNEPDFYRQYAEALSAQQRFGEAQEALRKMLDTAKEDATRLDAVNRLGTVYLQQGTLDELLQEFRGRVRNTPKKLSAYQELAALYKVGGDLPRSLETMEEAYAAVDEKESALRLLLNESMNQRDLKKAAAYHEQLLAVTSQVSSGDLERLGRLYAQLGDQDKARATWNRITEQKPDDPHAYEVYAKAMMMEGYADEAMGARVRALELNPYNYALRYQYAQDLANSDKLDEAIGQLQTLLDLGPPPQEAAATEAGKEKKVRPLMGRQATSTSTWSYGAYRGFQGGMLQFGAYPGLMSFGGGMGYYGLGAQWQGSFDSFRPQVIALMVQMAQRIDAVDSVVETFLEKTRQNPMNADAKADLLTVYEAANDQEKSIPLAEELLAMRPEDPILVERLVSLYQRGNQPDKTIALFERALARDPGRKRNLSFRLVPLYIQVGRQPEAMALVDAMLEDNPDDANVIMQTAGALQQLGRTEDAKTLYKEGIERFPQHRYNLTMQLANLAQQQGNIDEAWEFQERLLFGEDLRPAQSRRPVPALNMAVYVPPYSVGGGRRQSPFGNNFQSIASSLFSQLEYQRVQAFNQLSQYSLDDARLEPIVKRMAEEAANHAAAETVEARGRALSFAKMLIAYYASRGQLEKALETLQNFENAGVDDPEFINARLFLSDQLNRQSDMPALYDALEARFPNRRAEIGNGRRAAAFILGDFDSLEKEVRGLISQGGSSDEIIRAIQGIHQAKETSRAKVLLEEFLARGARPDAAVQLMARIHAEEKDYDKAIALARESWLTQSRLYRQPLNWYRGYRGRSLGGESIGFLSEMYNAAGRAPELAKELEDRLAKQPGSVPLHRELAFVYQQNGQLPKAIEVMERLVESRPHDTDTRLALAELYRAGDHVQQALAIYEDILKTQPQLFRSMSHQVREIYRRMGKQQELAKIEDKVLQRTTNPDEIMQMAWDARNNGAHSRAVELFRRALALNPTRPDLQLEIASTLSQAGRTDEALSAFEQFLENSSRQGLTVDSSRFRQMASLYAEAGRLEALKKKVEEGLHAHPDNIVYKVMQVQIARTEKRYDDALAILETLATGRGFNYLNEMAEVAALKEDYDAAIRYLEKAGVTGGYVDWARMGTYHLKKGDKAKALECWQKEALQQGGSYGFVNVLQRLRSNDLIPEAEAYYRQVRGAAALDENAMRQLDQEVMRAYFDGAGFHDIVEMEILPSDKAYLPDLVRSYLYQEALGFEKMRGLLQPVVERFKEDFELQKQYAQFLLRNEAIEDAVAQYKRLAEARPDDVNLWREYSQALRQSGEVENVIERIEPWALAKADPERLLLLGELYVQGGETQRFLAMREHRLAVATTEEEKRRIERALVGLQMAAGDDEGAKSVFEACYRSQPDTALTTQYLGLLIQNEQDEEALALLADAKEKGLLDFRGAMDLVVGLAVRTSDVAMLEEVLWQSAQEIHPNEYEWRIQQVMRRLNRMPARQLLERIEARARKEKPDDVRLLGMLAYAHEFNGSDAKALALLNECLEKLPNDGNYLRKKMEIALRTGTEGDRIAVLENGLENLSPQQDAGRYFELAKAYFEANRPDEAEAVLDRVRKSEGGRWQLNGLGQVYLDAGLVDKAIAAFEEYRTTDESSRRNAPQGLILAYAKAGRTEDAFKLSQETPRRNEGTYVARQLIDMKQFDLARRILEREIEKGPRHNEPYRLLAQAAWQQGDHDAFLGIFARACENQSKNRRRQLIGEFAGFLVEMKAVEELLTRPEATTNPLFLQALATSVSYGIDEPTARKVTEFLVKTELDDPVCQSLVAQALFRFDRKEEANVWLRRAAANPLATKNERLQAAHVMTQYGDITAAFEVYEEAIQAQPSLLVTQSNLPEVFAAVSLPERTELLLARLPEVCGSDAELRCVRAAYDYAAGHKEKALDTYSECAEAKSIRGPLRVAMARALAENGRADAALRIYRHLATNGWNQVERGSALLSAVELSVSAGRFDDAAWFFARLLPAFEGNTGAATDAISEKMTEADYEHFKNGVASVVAGNPAAGYVSDLVGLCAQMAERFGKPDTAATLAIAGNVTGTEYDESALWDAMIEEWLVSDAYSLLPQDGSPKPPQEEMATPLPDALAAAMGSTVTSGGHWTAVDPKATLGFVRMDRVLGKRAEDTANLAAYAVVQVTSPDDRDVEFSLGSDDWAMIWVNGQEVFRGLKGRAAFVDQDRFTARLKAGANAIVVRLGNNHSDWTFCLAPTRGDEGLTFAHPE